MLYEIKKEDFKDYLEFLTDKFELIAPEFLLKEIENNKSKILKLTKLSDNEFKSLYNILLNEIILVPEEKFIELLPKAKELAPHPKDAPYIALSLSTNSPILSGDKGLFSSELKIISPREFLRLLFA